MTEGGWSETPHLFDFGVDEIKLPVWRIEAQDFIELPDGSVRYSPGGC